MCETVHHRRATVAANSWDPATRTVRAVVASSAPVLGRSGKTEVLDLHGMTLPPSCPVLLDHVATVRTTVGTATDFRIEGSELVCTIRIADGVD
jgi:hypothetical protein